MTNLTTKQSKDRRATMTAEQRANLERLALVTERFHQRNLRMDRGLRFGFRKLEASDSQNPGIALPELRK
jgi:hypothetical protein